MSRTSQAHRRARADFAKRRHVRHDTPHGQSTPPARWCAAFARRARQIHNPHAAAAAFFVTARAPSTELSQAPAR